MKQYKINHPNFNGEIFDDYDDALETIYQQEIIYYSSAMEYLLENDASLVESAELAYDHGFTAKQITSELLATLLFQQELIEAIEEID